jgi:hypothetical protein
VNPEEALGNCTPCAAFHSGMGSGYESRVMGSMRAGPRVRCPMSDAPDDPRETVDDDPELPSSETESSRESDTASHAEEEPIGAELADEASSSRPRKRAKKSSKSSRSRKTGTVSARSGSRKASPPARSGSRGALFVAVALAVGMAGGWVLGVSRAGANDFAEAGPASSGSAGQPIQCQNWSDEICTQIGEQSAACMQAKGAGELLPASACKAALSDVPAIVERVRAARAVCDTLVSRLCRDLGETSQTCQMVKTKTESFPTDRCQEMIGKYDQVIGQLKMMEQRGMKPPRGPTPHGMPVSMPPPGAAPPGATPPGAAPH